MVQNRVQKETRSYMVTLILYKGTKKSNRERKVFPTNAAGTTGDPYGGGETEPQNPTSYHIQK